jgi:predicted nucleic acid-binding protein
VILAACGSATGASRFIFDLASTNGWSLVASQHILDEVERNLLKLGVDGTVVWGRLKSVMIVRQNIVTLDRIAVFNVAKDRPVLFSAFAYADALLTLDKADFIAKLGRQFYRLELTTPSLFLTEQRALGRLREPGSENMRS